MCIFSLFGCFQKDKYILDGPGMEREYEWISFTLSRSSSYANYNFAFSVNIKEKKAFVDGYCRDDNGEEYIDEEGIELSKQTLKELRGLKLEYLDDVSKESDDTDDGLIILDADITTLTLTLDINETVEKRISDDLTMQIHQLLSPYFYP